MSKKIRLGYDILSKRATETESGVNIDEALKKITSYKKVPGTGDDNHPDEPRPSTKVIYIVKVDGASQPDTFKEWIWNQPVDGVGNWECIGGTSDDANSWKRWSENRGSTGEGESVYLGVNDVANRDETYVLGKNNTTIVNDNTDYTNTDIVAVGSDNTATNAANAYQVGRENTVTGNNLANKDRYPHSMAMNLGRNNSITGEGVNIGKDNVSSTFGVTVGQRNQATNASIAIGEDVDSYSGSISIGHGKPSANSVKLSMLSMTIDGEEIPAQRIKLDLTEYTYYDIASVFKTASNTYEWGEIGKFSTRVTLYENQVLHTYLVGGNSASSRRVTGYFDSNGNFISSTDPSYNINEYDHITEVNGVPVDFYCSRENDTRVAVSGYFKKSETQPAFGTVLNASEYAEWLSKLSISDATYTNINVYTADLSAPAMKCYYSGTNRPFYTQYSVYGYRDDNNNFIPYNDVTKYKSNAFAWETIPADELHASELDPAVVGYETPKTISRNDSIAIGKSMEADTSSFGIGIGTLYPQVMYEKASDANGWIGCTDTRFQPLTISQVDGSVTQCDWITYNRVWFNSKVDDVSWSASAPSRTVMGNSIAIVNTGSSSSYHTYLSGASVGIGNGLKLTDNSFGFGTNLEGDNNSVLVGSSLTSQVGGSTIVGRYISVKLGDSDNDGGTISGEYDGGLVAFGMAIYPAPGSVTIGSNGVTTGRGSLAVGLGGITAKRGSIVYGRNGISAEGSSAVFGVDGTNAVGHSMALGLSSAVSAESSGLAIGLDGYVRATACALAMGVREGSVIAHGNALAIGLGAQSTTGSGTTTVNATYRSASFGIGDVYASYNSMAVGKDGASATNGGMIFGKTSYIANQGMGFGTGLDASGGFAFGCGVAARSAGLAIGTTSIGSDTNASPYRIGDWVDMEGVNATLFAYLNPDGQYVPLQGYLQPTKGTINCCAYYKNIEHDGTTYPYAITESGGSTSNCPYWWDYNQQTWRYIGNSGNDDLYQTAVQQIYYGLLHQYVDNNGKTVYEVIDVPSYDKLNEDSNIVLTYYAVWAQTFTKDGNTYVYGTGLGYDDNGTPLYELTNMYIPLNDNHVSRRNQKWPPAVLGYYSNEESEWQNRWKDDFSRMSTTSSVSVGGGAAHHTSFTFGQYAQGNLDYPNITNLIHSNGSSSFIPQRLEITKVYLADNQSIKICNGCNNTSDGASILVGFYGNNARWRSMIIGQQYNFAEGTSFIAGLDNNVAVSRSIAVGSDNISSGQSIAVGYNAYAYEHGVSFGRLVRASNDGVAIGIGSEASAYSVLLGLYSQSSKMSSTVGYYSKARDNSISIGNYCYSSNFGLAIGNSCTSAERTMAIGHNNIAFDAGIAIGSDCSAVEQSIAVGINNKMGVNNIAFGIDNSYVASSTGMAIGVNNAIGYGGYNIVAGKSNKAAYETISIGTTNDASGWSIALGVHNTSYNGPGGHATMIGQFNTSTSNQEVIHKEFKGQFIPGVPYVPTETELGRVSQYRNTIDTALATGFNSSEMRIFDDQFDSNEAYYLGRSNVMPSPSSEFNSLFAQLQQTPMYIITDEDKSEWMNTYRNLPSSWPEVKNSYIVLFEIIEKYDTAVSSTLRDIKNASTAEEFNAVMMNPSESVMMVWQNFYYSANYQGEPVLGRLSTEQYAAFYRAFTQYTQLLTNIRAKIDESSDGHYETIEEDVVCNSFLVGNSNKSNHYNSILIGALNESQTPLVQPDATYHTTDDDGFMIAIGYRNVVGRNYDIAIGYGSKAIGGENVSIQHSTAKGYRNLSMFDSTIYGTANAGIIESNIVPLTADDQNYGAFTHNFVVNSRAEYSGWGGPIDPYEGGGYHSFHRNVIFDASLRSESTSTVQENFIFGGSGYQKTSYGTDNTAAICISATDGVQSNIILGLHRNYSNHPEININANNTVMSNFMVLPDVTTIQSLGELHQNQFVFSTINVTGHSNSSSLEGNIVFRSSISGTIEHAAENILFGKSNLYVDTDTIGTRLALHNILLSNSNLSSSAYRSFWDGTSQPCSNNVLIGSEGINILSCFSYTDSSGGATIENALRVYNFGDNYFTRVAHTFTAGNSNTITGANLSFVGGHANYITSTATANGKGISGITVLGSQNQVHNTNSTGHLDRLFIAGDQNNVYNDSFDNVILGSQNDIQYNSSTYTDESPAGSDAYPTSRVAIIGHRNHVGIKIHDYAILGIGNDVTSTTPVSAGLVQGSGNVATNGSNIVIMGNGNASTGHNSVAIGSQLISDQWQTVLGKYNEPISGPDRLTDPADEADKALLIVGNGYSDTDGDDWQDETQIHRSNAMVVYANGDTVFSGNVNAANLPPAPSNDGRYALNCIVTNGVPSYSWVPVGTVTV